MLSLIRASAQRSLLRIADAGTRALARPVRVSCAGRRAAKLGHAKRDANHLLVRRHVPNDENLEPVGHCAAERGFDLLQGAREVVASVRVPPAGRAGCTQRGRAFRMSSAFSVSFMNE